ncbi:phosphate ABC transporter ATP-binding protein PstB [Caldinitratiruptor microaerophilus]|uniref:Phosphate import ATP-binding protein PstB n=1 Tax=Caldinitratiruptor microaerophilus TaxID=671077 RepID=A0AA35CKB2_9FIRM|nr:phosphate ABC transporter ATP-binding protein PstB [Caldinitratiruptor microaerophilus]BDG60697.1 phosphate import ATP-binding protein PstB [Caldinitratiruptor microaerophilus]
MDVHEKIRVEDLSVRFGGRPALRHVTLPVPARQVLAVIGPSGCGKSTLLRCLNRLVELVPDAEVRGRVLLDGEDVYACGADPIAVRRRIGMVFQQPNPFPTSIYENVAYGLRVQGVRARSELDGRVEASLRAAGLWEEVKSRLHESALRLSGGQQQRLCIARSLATGPEVLLLDEPTAALDPASAARIEDLVWSLRERYTIVIVTHNMQQAARVSDYTAFLLMGELVEYGPTGSLFTNPRDQRTEDYVTGRFG